MAKIKEKTLNAAREKRVSFSLGKKLEPKKKKKENQLTSLYKLAGQREWHVIFKVLRGKQVTWDTLPSKMII